MMCALCTLFAMTSAGLCLAPARGSSQASRILLHRRILDACTWLGSAPLVSQIAACAPWLVCEDAIREAAAARALYLGRRCAAGMMVVAMLVVSLLFAWLVGSVLGVAVALIACVAMVPVFAASLERARKEAIATAMPDLLRSLSSSLGAGKTLTQAIGYVGSHAKGDAGRAFLRASLAVECGMSIADALTELERELDAPGVSLLACALTVSQRTGAPLDGLLRRSAALVEEQQSLKAELSTKTAQVRLSAHLVMILPAALVAFLAMLTPDYRQGLSTPVGLVCLLIACALDVVALFAMRKIMAEVRP